jgi:phosphoribosylaminoimidazole-succinocarboxamide synthase
MTDKPLTEINLPLNLFKKGKVRDIFAVGEDALLLVATDRISAFDVVMSTGIPDKGKILTQISKFWFDFMKQVIDNHIISAEVDEFPNELRKFKDILSKRSMLVKKVKPIPVECVVRGYLAGSAWKEYKNKGMVNGMKMPEGLVSASKLSEPIFTPTTKEEAGHDLPITLEQLSGKIGAEEAKFLENKSIEIYKKGGKFAEERGLILSDTKFEFGYLKDNIILIDELLTPDSSRFWLKDKYIEGAEIQQGIDKQYLRDYLETLDWDKTPPAPPLPPEVVQTVYQKYFDAYKNITGKNEI